MHKIIQRVEYLISLANGKSYLFQINTFLFLIWFSVYAYLQLRFNDTMKQFITGLQYSFLVICNIYSWRKISENPQFASLKPTKMSYVRYILLLNYKEAQYADKTQNYSFKCLLLLYNFYQNFILYISILEYKLLAFNNDSDTENYEKNYYYWFVIFSIIYQSYHSFMIIHSFSNNSRYIFSIKRNALAFLYIFCSIYTLYTSDQFINDGDLHLNLVILTILVNFISFWIAFDKPIEAPIFSMWMRILLKGCLLIVLFTTNLEIQITPIYNKPLSEYYQYVNRIPFKVYRFLKLVKLIILLILSYQLHTSDFESQNPYISSLIIMAIYCALSFAFIIHDILTEIFPVVVDVSLTKPIQAEISNENSQFLQSGELVINNQQESLIQNQQQQSHGISKQSIFHQLFKIKLETLEERNYYAKDMLPNIFKEYENFNFIIGENQNENDNFWFAKDGKYLVLLANFKNFQSIIETLKQTPFMHRYQLLLGFQEKLNSQAISILISALQINIFHLDVYSSNIAFFSKRLHIYLKNFKSNQESTFASIISFHKHIANSQLINPAQLIYDLYD